MRKPKPNQSLTICLTVRDERDNIEKIVTSLPRLTDKQEILFVEGHSTDGTFEEIQRVMKKYPHKNIRLIKQMGIGQGDAIRIGFRRAKGEIIILYEGDGTSDPNDIKQFYDAIANEKYQFIEGNRFTYPNTLKAMSLTHRIGNWFFAKWFSLILKQPIHDVLSGIKAILKKDYDSLYETWGFSGITDPFGDFELLFGAIRLKLRIGELPIHYYPRSYGVSKTKTLAHGFMLLKMAILGSIYVRRT